MNKQNEGCLEAQTGILFCKYHLTAGQVTWLHRTVCASGLSALGDKGFHQQHV